MQDYYSIPAEKFSQIKNYDFNFVSSHDELCKEFAREMVDLMKENASNGRMTKVILPVGPLSYGQFANLCNKEGVSCESLVIFAMDEYLDGQDRPLSLDHPLSFRAYFQRTFIDRLDKDKKIPEDQIIMPTPDTMDFIPNKIEELGGIDVTYGGLGINGHLAFNSPPDDEMDLVSFKNTTVRIIDLREGDRVQFAIGGTFGNLEIVPMRACTLGMSELLSAKQIHMVFMRPWHAGVLRRALFGPVTINCPGSLVQQHSKVKVTITPEAAQVPSFSLLLGLDK